VHITDMFKVTVINEWLSKTCCFHFFEFFRILTAVVENLWGASI